MIIAGLIALFSVFFGVSEVALFVDNMPKYVKKYVTDDDRKEQALNTVNGYLADADAHKTRVKAFHKEMDAMFVDPLITVESFEIFMESVIQSRNDLQIAYVKMRVELSNSINEDEWKMIMEAGREPYKKELEKKKKDKGKLDELLDKVSENMLKHYESAESREAAREVLDAYNTTIKKLAQQRADFDAYAESGLLEYEVDYDALLTSIVEKNLKRGFVSELFIATYFELKEIASEEEWPKVAKAFKKFY